MGHGGVADEIKGRGRGGGGESGAILSIEEEGVAFRSYVDGRDRFISPEVSMSVQAALGSDIALVFDECTPFHVTREYTERSMERTHRWLDRCLRWHDEHGPAGQVVYGIVQGGVDQDLRIVSVGAVAESSCDGVAIGGSLGQDKAQMYAVVSWTTAELERVAPDRPRHLLGIGDVDDLIARRRVRDRHVRLRPADAARAPRRRARARPGGAVARRPRQGPVARFARPDPRRLPLPRVLGRLHARVPPLPAPRRRAHRAAARDASQPVVHRSADGRSAGRDRRRAAGGGGGGVARWRGAGGGPAHVQRTESPGCGRSPHKHSPCLCRRGGWRPG